MNEEKQKTLGQVLWELVNPCQQPSGWNQPWWDSSVVQFWEGCANAVIQHFINTSQDGWNPKEYDLFMQVQSLTSERDQLRKEVEEYKQSLRLIADSRDGWKSAAEESHEAAKRNEVERNEALAKLSRFQWKPVSTPPTEADGLKTSLDGLWVIWTNLKYGPWVGTLTNTTFNGEPAAHWMRIPPLPSFSECDELDNGFTEWWHSQEPDKVPAMQAVSMAAARHIWEAAKKSMTNS